ncbi:MAG: CHAT domain-containing protein, partial [Proteobacteria bacterium]|nr:CHAT domain-containing protein [Pseudomonadota bacterium]
RLYENLVKPIVPHIKSIKNIIIIPHRVLNYINFESMNVKGNDNNISGNQYLINFYTISYLPSISVFQLLSHRDKNRSGIDKSLLLYANPNFERDERIEEKKGEINVGRGEKTQLQNLALSLKEANDIKKYFSSSKICTGMEATEDNFKTLAPNYKIVHVATHGILHDNPQFQGLTFSYNEKNQEVDILKTYEVYRLNLNCELITLSACETGISQKLENIGLDGVEGISRAFLYAGTKSLVVSLWQVADESTSILMSEFYKNYIQEGMSKSEALRQAKLSLIKMSKKVGKLEISYAHPFFWAPFILIGDPGYLN